MKTSFTDISDFKSTLKSDETLQKALVADPINTIENIRQSPLEYDVWIYRLVVGTLGISILTIVLGVVLLINADHITDQKKVPDILTAIGSAAIGALAGLLAPSPKTAK